MNDIATLAPAARSDGVEAPARFSITEFETMLVTGIFEGWKVELDEGIIVRMSPSQRQHIYYRGLVHRELYEAFRGSGTDWTVYTELTLRLGPATLRDADVGVIAAFEPAKDYADPDDVLMIVEVSATTLDYDLTNKARDYARAGIPTYWVVDIEGRQTFVFSGPDGEAYGDPPSTTAFGEALQVPGTTRTIVIG